VTFIGLIFMKLSALLATFCEVHL